MSRTGSLTALALAVALPFAASCSRPHQLPPPPDTTEAMRGLWSAAPKDAIGGFVVADVGATLDQLRAFKKLLDTGPATRAALQKGMAQVITAVGFDPLDSDAWRKAGIEPSGPVAVFFGESKTTVVFHGLDVKKAHDTADAWAAHVATTPPTFDCARVSTYSCTGKCIAPGMLMQCGTPGWQIAATPGESMGAGIDKQVPADYLNAGILGFLPLDRGSIAAANANAKPGSPLAGWHAAYMGLTLAPERFIMRMGAHGDYASKVMPYLEPHANSSLLGLADDCLSVGRFTFSPERTWALARAQLGTVIDQGLGVAQAATGIDLEKELVNNLTGQLEMITYRSDRLGADGKHRPLQQRMGSAFVLGTTDDALTRHLANRAGELLGGFAGTLANNAAMQGAKITYRSEPGDRPVHWFSIEVSSDQAAVLGVNKMEVFLTSIPGGLAIGEGRIGLEELRKRVGRKESAFLDKLPLDDERAMFAHAQVASWMRAGEGFAQRMEDVPAVAPLLKLFGPEGGKLMNEVMQLGQLLFDGSVSMQVDNERAELFYQLTYL